MPEEKRSLDTIFEEWKTRMSEQVADVDAKVKALADEQSRSFSRTVNYLEQVLQAQGLEAQRKLSDHADRRLEDTIENIKEKSEAASKQVRNIGVVLAALLFAGSFVFLNEQREKATEKAIAFQNELIAAHTSVDTSVANLRADVRDAEAKMNDVKKALAAADEQLTAKQQQLSAASAKLDSAEREYEHLASSVKAHTR